MKVGIDKIDFYTPNQYLDLKDLASARQVDPNKYLIGIGQQKMAVAPLDQDIVSMAANAAEPLLTLQDQQQLGLVIVGTESGIDQSKASALFVQDVLALPTNLRAVEIKEACFGATAGLQLAADFVRLHPNKKALVIASDIARYGLKSAGEVTQGAGAVAMLVGADPQILALKEQSFYMSQSTGDFWRPNYSTEAFARGKYSEEVYIAMFTELWQQFVKSDGAAVSDLAALLFHIPFSKMGRKALKSLASKITEVDYQRLTQRFEASIMYGQQVGNIYTGSLYLSLLSLLENDASLNPGEAIGLYSYGSGSEAELFFGILQPHFRAGLNIEKHQHLLRQRQQLTVAQYEQQFQQGLVTDGSTQVLANSDPQAAHRLVEIVHHERKYQ